MQLFLKNPYKLGFLRFECYFFRKFRIFAKTTFKLTNTRNACMIKAEIIGFLQVYMTIREVLCLWKR